MLKLRRPENWRNLGALNATLLVAVLGLAGGGAWLVWGTPGTAEMADSATATATRTDVTSTVSADGTVAPTDSADVSFDTDGIIAEIPVEVGDEVQVGDVLALVSSSTAAARLKSAEASLEAAEDAEDAVDEAEDATQSDEEREKDESSARAQVEQAKLSLAEVRDSLSDLTLRAPVAGTVTAINSTVGSSTTGDGSGSESDSGNTFATIADMSSWVVDCAFSEADVAKVKEGDAVEITFGSVPNETFTGRVRKIDLSATTSENVTTYGVEVDVLNAPSELRDGASSSVTVTTASASDVLAVPTSAVTTDAQGESTVKLVKDGKSTPRTVQIGIKGDTYTEITSGLSAGNEVELGATSTSSSDSDRGDFRVGRGPGPAGAGGATVIKGAGG
jgi:macrolide-specific efflux system membrane fusion protein